MYDDILLLVHPWVAPTFASTISPDWHPNEVARHVSTEVERVVGNPAHYRVQHEYLGADNVLGNRVDRILISCVPMRAYRFGKTLGNAGVEVKSSPAAIAGHLSRQEGGLDSVGSSTVRLGLGFYDGWIECVIIRDGSFRFAGCARSSAQELGALALSRLLTQAGLSSSDHVRVVLYGHSADTSILSNIDIVSGSETTCLKPRDSFDPKTRKINDDPSFALVAAGVVSHLLDKV